MKVSETTIESIHGIIAEVGTNTPLLNSGQYKNAPGILRLVLDNNLFNIVELHSPGAHVGQLLCNVFEDIICTSICDHFDFDQDNISDAIANLVCIEDYSDSILTEFNDKSVDLVYMHDHNLPYYEVKKTLDEWLPKVRDGGIICGTHVGIKTNNMNEQAYSLYAFAKEANLSIQCLNNNTFYCVNTPVPEETRLRPIRLLDTSHEIT